MQGHLDSRAIELAAEAKQIARDARDQCQREYDGLITDLRQHREETHRRFDRQDADRKSMHAENQTKFDRLFRALYITIGVGMAGSSVLPWFGPALLKFLLPP